MGALVPQAMPAGQRGHHAVGGRVDKEAVDLQPHLLVVLVVQHGLEEILVALEGRQLHADNLRRALHGGGGKAVAGLDIVVHRHLQRAEGTGIADVLQVEHEVLAQADVGVHAQSVVHDHVPAVELVPQYAVVEVGGAVHHVGHVFLPGQYALVADTALVGQPFPHHPVEVRHHHVAAALLGGAYHQAGAVGGDPVVAVHKLQVLAPGLLHAQVPRVGHAAVFLVDHPYPPVLPGIAVADGRGAVGGAVVHQQQLKVRIFLAQDAVHAPAQIFLRIVHRHDDAHRYRHADPSVPSSC